ncbi:MAG: helix-turn-helix domain containing protein, partial [Chromatiaceae bacterium]|nr:helix-turn-helix domain containing protein [Chromatiaceae bacterium]
SASDATAVAQLLNCSERQARDLTAAARNEAKEQQRAAILDQISKGLSQREVAKAFGISAAMVNNIVHKRRSAESEHLEPRSIQPDPPEKASTDSPSRDHLTPWQKDVLARLDAQAKLNGRAGVAAAVEAWMSEGGAA